MTDTSRRRCPILCALFAVFALHYPVQAALPPFTPGQLLLMDKDASQGNGQLFEINRSTGVATPIGNGFGYEPWSMVLRTPSDLLAADVSGQTVYRLDLATGNWSGIITPPYQLRYPCGAMVPDSDHSVLVASGLGKVYRVDTVTGQQTLYSDYNSFNTNDPWGMTRLADNSLIVTDLAARKIVRIYSSGAVSLVSSGGLLHSLKGIIGLPDGNLAVANEDSYGVGSIIKVNPLDGSQSYLSPPGSFWDANALALDLDGNLLVADNATNTRGGRLYKLNLSNGAISIVSSDPHLASPS